MKSEKRNERERRYFSLHCNQSPYQNIKSILKIKMIYLSNKEYNLSNHYHLVGGSRTYASLFFSYGER